MQNIGESNASDQFYRYKRPKLVARIEGRGNGIKTNTVNLTDIAKALERPPEYVLKFFGCELGAQTKYDKNSGTCIVNGAHELNKLNELLESFTKKYVQCHQCGNPETRIKIRKDNIFLKCKACGNTSDVDMRHRLNTFILKNPPEDKISKAEKRLKKMEEERMKEASGDALDKEAKERRKKEKEAKKKKKSAGEDETEASATEGETGREDDEEEDADDDVVWMTDTSEAAVAKRAAEQLSAATSDMVTQGNLEAEREEARKAEKARKKEEARLAAEAKAKAEAEATAEAERIKAEEAAKAARKVEEDAKLAKESSSKLSLEDGASEAVVAALRELCSGPGFTPKKATAKLKQLDFEAGVAGRARVFYLALFGNLGAHKLGPAIEARAEVLQAEAAGDPAKQVGQLVALEYLVGVALPDKVKQTAVALKALYDEDVVEEDVMIAWYDKPTAAKVLGVPFEAAKAVREAAEPFVTWLKEASDDEEEDSDEE